MQLIFLIKNKNSEISPRENEAISNMHSGEIENENVEEANKTRKTNYKDLYKNDLCSAKRYSKSNFELNTNTSLKSQFTIFCKENDRFFH